MRRRDVLAGILGTATVGGAAVYLSSERSAGRVEPVGLSPVEAPGSDAESIVVPEPGRVTFLEFFATWCEVCAEAMGPLAAAYDRVPDDVQFVSVTNEPIGHAVTREEIRRWWIEHGGSWPVAPDADLALTEALDVSSVPTAIVLDPDNVVTWRSTGVHPVDELLDHIEAAAGTDGR